MKKIVTISIFTGVALALGAVAYFIVKAVKQRGGSTNNFKDALFVGDSSTISSAGAPSYASYLSNAKGFNEKIIAQVGISTAAILKNLQSELGKNKYDIVVILGGYNDNYALGGTADSRFKKTSTNLQTMYDLVHSKGAKVVALTPPASAGNKTYSQDKQQFHSLINDWIMRSNADYKIDLYSIETGGRNNSKPLAGMTGLDGEHMTDKAHQLIADAIGRQLV